MKQVWLNILYTSIAVLILVNVGRIYKMTVTDDAPSDYRSLFIGGKYLAATPLYDTAACISRWQEIVEAENLSSTSAPGQIHISALTYPPHAYPLFVFNSLLSWKQGRIVWWTLCILFFILILYWIGDGLLISLALAFKGSFFALLMGQPMLLVVLMLAWIISRVEQGKFFIAGVFIPLALIKFTLAIPVLIWYIILKRWNVLIFGGLLTMIIYAVLFCLFPGVLQDYFLRAEEYYQFIYSASELNLYPQLNSELTTAIHAYIPLSMDIVKGINIGGQVIGFGVLAMLFYRNKIDKSWLLYMLCLVSFLFSYHLIYDGLFLLIPIALIHRSRPERSWVYLVPFVLMCLPWNVLASHISIAQYHFPVLIAAALILAFWDRE